MQVFRAGTKPKRVCDDCVKTFPLTTKIVSNTTNTIESGNRPPLSLSASDAADTCAERTMLSPGPVTAFFGIGMVGVSSSWTLPPPTSTGGDDSAPTPLATAFARLQVETINRVFFGDRRASGDNVGKKPPGIQIAATTEMETPPSPSSPPPMQQQDWAQGGMGLVTNGGQGQAESDYAGPDFDCVVSAPAVVPAVVADEVQKVAYNEVPLEDAEASHAQATNQADTFDRAVLGLDVSHFASTTADTPTNYYTPAAATPAYHKAEVQKPVQTEVAAEDADAPCSHDINEGGTVDGALVELEVTAAESTVGANSTPFFAASSSLTATPPSPPTTASPSQDQEEVEHNGIAAKCTDVSQAGVNTKTGIVNGAPFELKASETDASIATTVDSLTGATPAYRATELLTEKVQVHNEVTKEDSDASDASKTIQIIPAKLEVVLPAPGEHQIENDAKTAAAYLASTSSKNNGACLMWIHFTSEIICGCLAAVFMGLAVGLLFT